MKIIFLYADRRGITFSIDPAWSNSARTLKITPQETFCLFSLYIVIFSTISYFFLFFYQGADGAFESVPDGAAGEQPMNYCHSRWKQARNTTNHRDHHLKNTRWLTTISYHRSKLSLLELLIRTAPGGGRGGRRTDKFLWRALATEGLSLALTQLRSLARNANAIEIEIDFPVRGSD